jgi:hypothetical protein
MSHESNQQMDNRVFVLIFEILFYAVLRTKINCSLKIIKAQMQKSPEVIWAFLKGSRHPREGGDPFFQELDPRLREDDDE